MAEDPLILDPLAGMLWTSQQARGPSARWRHRVAAAWGSDPGRQP